MRDTFDSVGLVYLKNTGLTEYSDMKAFVDVVVPPETQMVYEGGANLRRYIDKNVYDTGIDGSIGVHYHHEMAYIQNTTRTIAFMAKYMPETP
jgi:hypothetical protein